MRIHNPNWARYLQDGSDGYAASLLRNRRKRHRGASGSSPVNSKDLGEDKEMYDADEDVESIHSVLPAVTIQPSLSSASGTA